MLFWRGSSVFVLVVAFMVARDAQGSLKLFLFCSESIRVGASVGNGWRKKEQPGKMCRGRSARSVPLACGLEWK